MAFVTQPLHAFQLNNLCFNMIGYISMLCKEWWNGKLLYPTNLQVHIPYLLQRLWISHTLQRLCHHLAAGDLFSSWRCNYQSDNEDGLILLNSKKLIGSMLPQHHVRYQWKLSRVYFERLVTKEPKSIKLTNKIVPVWGTEAIFVLLKPGIECIWSCVVFQYSYPRSISGFKVTINRNSRSIYYNIRNLTLVDIVTEVQLRYIRTYTKNQNNYINSLSV